MLLVCILPFFLLLGEYHPVFPLQEFSFPQPKGNYLYHLVIAFLFRVKIEWRGNGIFKVTINSLSIGY